MNSIMICIIGLFFGILVNTVTGTCEHYPATHGTLEAPFTFAYMLSAEFNLIVRLKNPSPIITKIAVTIYADGQLMSNEWDSYIAAEFRVCGDASSYNRLTVGLELYSSNGLCSTRLVSEGRHVRTLEYGLADSTYKSINLCLDYPNSTCAIEMDLRHDCIEIQTNPNANRKTSYVTPKPPQNIPYSTRHTPIIPKRKIPDTPKPKNKYSDNTRHTPSTPKIPDTPKSTNKHPNNTRHTPISPKRKIGDTRKPTKEQLIETRYTPTTPKSKITEIPKPNKTKHTPTTPKGTIPDTAELTNEYPNNKRHSPITLKPISNAPYIPDTIRNTSRTLATTTLERERKISDTPKPTRNISDTTTSITSKPTYFYTPIATQNISDTPKPTHNISDTSKLTHNISDVFNKSFMLGTLKATLDTQQAAQNKSYTPNGTQLTSNTSKTADLKNDVADDKKYITITIISAVSIMVLIVLVVIVRKCCCIKNNPSGSSQLLANDVGSPFYLNMLFRKECDQEIELIEQHHYEEIPLERVSATAANLNGD